MTEIEKLHGLHNTGMTMHERFTLLAQMQVGRRGKRNPFAVRTQSQTMKADLIEAIGHQIQYQNRRPFRGFGPRGRGRGRGGLRRFGSEGSLAGMPGLRKQRSNSFGNLSQSSKNQQWRRSNGNLTSMNGSIYSFSSEQSQGSRRRGVMRGRGVRGRGRGRGFRGRTHQGRVTRINDTESGRARPMRGSGRRGMRRNTNNAGAGRGWARGRGFSRGRGRGRGGMTRSQPPKPVPTKEELDAQLDQYMAGTKAALDKELDEYMRNAMDFE